ncbi:MAG: T9SS type A sorting domain-containing protein [Chitinophagales bacterium]|nr:T9SS type A sorting domain-containing protein [Chitinophagales bacterium]
MKSFFTGKIILSLLVIIGCTNIAYNQKYDANWVFGDSAGLKFLDGGVTQPFSSSIHSFESSASISDSLGNILFYSDAISIWNSNNEIMENGTELFSNLLSYEENTSCTQGSLILPIPGKMNEYYVFSLSPFNYGPGLSYAIVDINLNGGLGKVISKNNIILEGNLTEKMVAIKHGNGRDWWLILHELLTDKFFKFLITPDGIIEMNFQNIGSIYNFNAYSNIFGQLSVSENGTKICAGSANITDLFDFDRCSGELNNWISFDPPLIEDYLAYASCFSETNKFLYLNIGFKWLYQLDVDPDSPDFGIWNLIYELDNTFEYKIGQLQMGPDKKIYAPISYVTSEEIYTSLNMNLSIINSPDFGGVSCNFDTATINLGGFRAFAGLPNMPNYNLGALVASDCDTITTSIPEISNINYFSISPNPARNEIYIKTNNFESDLFDISIINPLGAQVIYKNGRQLNVPIDISKLQPGIYLVQLFQNNYLVGVEKLVVY